MELGRKAAGNGLCSLLSIESSQQIQLKNILLRAFDSSTAVKVVSRLPFTLSPVGYWKVVKKY